ncbi:MAG: hypothetical protein NTZ67_00890 [Gammaproteobacteria bacterium]|nr:hypothetical protein [Gammaproteobacteria bacterium]
METKNIKEQIKTLLGVALDKEKNGNIQNAVLEGFFDIPNDKKKLDALREIVKDEAAKEVNERNQTLLSLCEAIELLNTQEVGEMNLEQFINNTNFNLVRAGVVPSDKKSVPSATDILAGLREQICKSNSETSTNQAISLEAINTAVFSEIMTARTVAEMPVGFQGGTYSGLVSKVSLILFGNKALTDQHSLLSEAMIKTILMDNFIKTARKSFYDALEKNRSIKNASDVASTQLTNLITSFVKAAHIFTVESVNSPLPAMKLYSGFQATEGISQFVANIVTGLVSKMTPAQVELSNKTEAAAIMSSESIKRDLLQSESDQLYVQFEEENDRAKIANIFSNKKVSLETKTMSADEFQQMLDSFVLPGEENASKKTTHESNENQFPALAALFQANLSDSESKMRASITLLQLAIAAGAVFAAGKLAAVMSTALAGQANRNDSASSSTDGGTPENTDPVSPVHLTGKPGDDSLAVAQVVIAAQAQRKEKPAASEEEKNHAATMIQRLVRKKLPRKREDLPVGTAEKKVYPLGVNFSNKPSTSKQAAAQHEAWFPSQEAANPTGTEFSTANDPDNVGPLTNEEKEKRKKTFKGWRSMREAQQSTVPQSPEILAQNKAKREEYYSESKTTPSNKSTVAANPNPRLPATGPSIDNGKAPQKNGNRFPREKPNELIKTYGKFASAKTITEKAKLFNEAATNFNTWEPTYLNDGIKIKALNEIARIFELIHKYIASRVVYSDDLEDVKKHLNLSRFFMYRDASATGKKVDSAVGLEIKILKEIFNNHDNHDNPEAALVAIKIALQNAEEFNNTESGKSRLTSTGDYGKCLEKCLSIVKDVQLPASNQSPTQ